MKHRYKTLLPVLLVGVLVAASAPASAATPRDALRIARAGATQLALGQIEAGEAAVPDESATWARWERARLEILQSLGNQQAVIERVQALPASVPRSFRAWALIQAAEAQLAGGAPKGARRELRKRAQFAPDDNTAAANRAARLMIRSFVMEGRLDHAATLMRTRRGRQPDKPDSRFIMLEARIALLAGRPGHAWALLGGTDQPGARPLKWLAGLRAGKLEPGVVSRDSRAFAEKNHSTASRRAALVVAGEAALSMNEPAARIARLEEALTIGSAAMDARAPFALSSDDVWKALLGLGRVLRSRKSPPPSNDGERSIGKQALLALAATESEGATQRQAQSQLVALLTARPRGDQLLQRLYLHSKRFTATDDIPAPARYQLALQTFSAGDMTLAARLMARLEAPPKGDAIDWQLKRARAFILTGRGDAGIRIIDTVFAGGDGIGFEQLRPSLFALQAANRDRDAIRYFRKLLAQDPPAATRQRMWYWMAASFANLGQYNKAALHYLRAATAIDPLTLNRWARTARYQAADALAKAGLVKDARRVYQRLLNASADPARRAVLRKKMDSLTRAD